MNDSSERMLTPLEKSAADQAFEVFSDLDDEQVERVISDVQKRLNEARCDRFADDLPMFSRGIAGPLGKLEHVLKTKVDEHTHTLFLQQCGMQRTDASSQIRNCVYALVHGKSYDQMVVEKINHDTQRTEALVKLIGPFGGPELAE